MFKKNPILKYESAINYTDNSILPAKKFIPDWYKKIPKNKNENQIVYDNEKGFAPSVKLCLPFLDAFSSGYMIKLPYDLYIKNNNGAPFLVGPSGIPDNQLPGWRESIAHENIVPSGCYPYEYAWNYCIAYSVPTGFSMLATHPFNRWDLPFVTLTGIIDGGLVMQPNGNFPFYIKAGFEGVIPQGTPIIQILPFRQEKWKSEKQVGLVEQGLKHRLASAAKLSGWYKNVFWIRKEYD